MLGHYIHILLLFAYRQSPQIPVVNGMLFSICHYIGLHTHAHTLPTQDRYCDLFVTSKTSSFSSAVSKKWGGSQANTAKRGIWSHTYTHSLPCSRRAMDKVNGNYPEDLARNLQTDTNALCCCDGCVPVRRVCAANMCVLWNVIAHFKICYTKHILKTVVCPFKQTVEWMPTGQESFLKYITSLPHTRHPSLCLWTQHQRGHLKVDLCRPAFSPSSTRLGSLFSSVSSPDISFLKMINVTLGRICLSFYNQGKCSPTTFPSYCPAFFSKLLWGLMTFQQVKTN